MAKDRPRRETRKPKKSDIKAPAAVTPRPIAVPVKQEK
jgi:hypothetical protein